MATKLNYITLLISILMLSTILGPVESISPHEIAREVNGLLMDARTSRQSVHPDIIGSFLVVIALNSVTLLSVYLRLIHANFSNLRIAQFAPIYNDY